MRRKSTPWENPSHWVQCAHGHDHWGRNGAAGMLLRHTDDSGLERYFLQQRGPYVQAPGTWSTPGGAIEPGESSHAAAMREAQEELGSFPAYNLQHLHTSDCGGWNYHLMRADVPQPFYPATAGWDNDETGDVGWFTPQEIDELPLHPGFRATWEQIKPNQKPDPHREIWSNALPWGRMNAPAPHTDVYEGDRVVTPEGPGEVWEVNPQESHALPIHVNLDQGYDDWYHPDEIQRAAATWSVPLEEQDGSTVPTEVQNPEDRWPEYGERPPDWPKHVDTDYEWAYTRV